MSNRLSQEEIQKRISETFEQNVELISEYINKRSDIILKCHDCNHTWTTKAQNILYHNVKSHQCPNCGTIASKKVEFSCANCGKQILRRPSEIKKNKSGYFYCSQECGNQHKNQLRMESGEWNNTTYNYRSKALFAYEHKCLCCGWNEDERLLEVHHIDKNHQNNDLNNLCLLCPTCHRKITLGYYTLNIETHQLVEKNQNE